MKVSLDQSELCRNIKMNNFYKTYGKIEQIVGMTVEASGITGNIGDICRMSSNLNKRVVLSEIAGFKEGKVVLCLILIWTASDTAALLRIPMKSL